MITRIHELLNDKRYALAEYVYRVTHAHAYSSIDENGMPHGHDMLYGSVMYKCTKCGKPWWR